MSMSKLRWLCAMVATTLAVSVLASAQEPAPPRARGPRGMQQMSVQDAMRQMELTAEQQKKAEPILKADAEARQKLTQELMQAFRGEDEAARTEARKKIQALDAKTKKQLAEVLTKEQMVKLERMTGPAGAFDRFVALVEKLELADKQKAELGTIVKTANTDAAAKAEAAPKIYQEAITKVNDLLSEEQRAKLRQLQQAQQLQLRVDRMLAGVSLTAEQKAKVQTLVEKAQKDSAAASDNQARREVMTKLMDSIRNDVLTEEQRDKLPPAPGGGR